MVNQQHFTRFKIFFQFDAKDHLEPLADRKVYKKVGGAVDDQEKVADSDEDEEPAWSQTAVARVSLIKFLTQKIFGHVER